MSSDPGARGRRSRRDQRILRAFRRTDPDFFLHGRRGATKHRTAVVQARRHGEPVQMSQLSFTGFGKEPETAPEAPPSAPVEVAPWYKGRVLSHSSISTYRACPQKW